MRGRQLYVEALVDVFHALNLAGTPATQPSYLQYLPPAGLQDVITFLAPPPPPAHRPCQ